MSPTLLALSTITVRPITARERERWDKLIDEQHYLRSHRMVGEQVRHVAVDGTGAWVALLGWCAGCARLAAREAWIGWSDGQRRARLHLVATNARFLVLGGRGEQPNLASRVLSLSLARLPADWEAAYGHPVVVAETFVDLRRPRGDGTREEIVRERAGTCYRAVGFSDIGLTRGFRRQREGFVRHGVQRVLLAREITPGACALLRSLETPWDRREQAPPPTQVDLLALPASFDPERGLLPHLVRTVRDPREKKQYPWGGILTGLLGGILAGNTTMEGVAAWADALPPETIQRIGGRFKGGRFRMPSPNTYRYALERVDLDEVNRAIRAWLADNGIDWAGELVHIDGKALLGAAKRGAPRHTAAAFVGARRALVAITEHAGDERDAARACLRQLDLRGCTVTADALHTDIDTALTAKHQGVTTSSRSRRTSRRCVA